MKLSSNAAYATVGDYSLNSIYQEYMYVTTAKTANLQVNTTTFIKATDILPVNYDTCS